eukprot:3848287-Pyramimonas_sp.AAC.1
MAEHGVAPLCHGSGYDAQRRSGRRARGRAAGAVASPSRTKPRQLLLNSADDAEARQGCD